MDEIAFWQAVLERDPGFDGKFVYGVRSTRVYCRPTCPSRRPRREQVVFFPRPEAAEEAGFRACRRCRPEEGGVCSISLGEDDACLEAALRREYPGAEIRRDDPALRPWASLLTNHLAGGEPHLELPLDVRATAFQWRVWEELRRIPYGSTRSYGQVACSAGCPGGARAAARACAANPVALAIPCHRVVRGDGGLGGYRWGVERKRLLLAQERASTRGTSTAGGEQGAATA